MSILRTSAAVVAALFLCACAGRSPQPVPVVQVQDKQMDCPAIYAEVNANNTKLQGLGREDSNKVAQNVAAGVVGLFFWPVLFAMDFQGTASKETAALQSRQTYLATMAEQRGCAAMPALAPPPEPKREPTPRSVAD